MQQRRVVSRSTAGRAATRLVLSNQQSPGKRVARLSPRHGDASLDFFSDDLLVLMITTSCPQSPGRERGGFRHGDASLDLLAQNGPSDDLMIATSCRLFADQARRRFSYMLFDKRKQQCRDERSSHTASFFSICTAREECGADNTSEQHRRFEQE